MKFADYIKSQEAEGKEKHVPAITVDECSSGKELSVKIQVGTEALHPATIEHHIKWIAVFGEANDDKFIHISTINLGEQFTPPKAIVNIKKDFKNVVVLSFCNIHGVWENSMEVENG
ncbi:MAG: desulfoferrodoxin family protein [Candidatus Auribacterota bacterium]|nr:desulfoferrodoxin family protein [Candidatus Auribacterota bacterium]